MRFQVFPPSKRATRNNLGGLPLLAASALLTPAAAQAKFPFQNSELPIEQRVHDIVSRLTLPEKAAQMGADAPAIPRLGIPAYYWGSESLHGYDHGGKSFDTVFPEPIGMAATFDIPLHAKVAGAIGDEDRAKFNRANAAAKPTPFYGLTLFAPNLNIFRDPRWGRGQETYGEDPYLTSLFGSTYIKGLQGDDPKYFKVIATAKHYAVHSGPETERQAFNAVVSPYDLHDTYLPAFKYAVTDGHVYSVMSTYSGLSGIPDPASDLLLQKILRDQWDFQGYVVSDCGAITDISSSHEFAPTQAAGAALAVKAGNDLACDSAYNSMPAAVAQGLITEAEIDKSLKRLFTARIKLGMFDPPSEVPYANIPASVIESPEHRALALQAARESIVLLKNDKNFLPLSPKIKSIAVIGPNADETVAQEGNDHGVSSHEVSILDGIRKRAGDNVKVTYVRVSGLLTAQKVAPAVDAAKAADAVIFVGGIAGAGEEGAGGVGDRATLDIPKVQQDLLEALYATKKPIVLVLLGGGALSVNWAEDKLPAILDAWCPGEEGGTAVADVLFGAYNPGGRLPVTFYTGLDQLPPFRDYSMNHRTYRYYEGHPLYPFGYGLSYTRFAYSKLNVPKETPPGGPVTVTAEVKNTGKLAGDEVVQLYLRPDPDGIPREIEPGQSMPRLILSGFQRANLQPGESKTVSFTIQHDQFLLFNAEGVKQLQPGAWQVYIGGGQPDVNSGKGALSAKIEAR